MAGDPCGHRHLPAVAGAMDGQRSPQTFQVALERSLAELRARLLEAHACSAEEWQEDAQASGAPPHRGSSTAGERRAAAAGPTSSPSSGGVLGPRTGRLALPPTVIGRPRSGSDRTQGVLPNPAPEAPLGEATQAKPRLHLERLADDTRGSGCSACTERGGAEARGSDALSSSASLLLAEPDAESTPSHGRSRKIRFSACPDDDGEDGPRQEASQQPSFFSSSDTHHFRPHAVWTAKSQFFGSKMVSQSRSTTFLRNLEADMDDGMDQLTWFDQLLEPLMLDPTSPVCMFWQTLGFLFVMCDTFSVPLQVFDPPASRATLVLEWLVRVFWNLDIGFSFLTGYLTEEGYVQKGPCPVAARYVRTWLIFDACLVGADWVEVLAASAWQLHGFQMFRALRVFRLFRLMRLQKQTLDLSKFITYKFQSHESLGVLASLVQIMCRLLIIVHFVACLWYHLGSSGHGWVQEVGVADESLAFLYTLSFHYAITQFVGSSDIAPHTHIERSFSVTVLLFGMVVSAYVVGAITTGMTRIHFLNAHSTERMTTLNRYLDDHGISSHLAIRIRRNVQHALNEERQNMPESRVELFRFLSKPLHMEVHSEVRGPILMWTPFFRAYSKTNPVAFHEVCHHAISHVSLASGDILFSEGSVPDNPNMFFILKGRLTYFQECRRPISLVEGQAIAEAVLWTPWSYRGTARATTECKIMCLSAEHFRTIAGQYRTAAFHPGKYAIDFVNQLNQLDEFSLTDVLEDEFDAHRIMEEVFGDIYDHNTSVTGMRLFKTLRGSVGRSSSKPASWRSSRTSDLSAVSSVVGLDAPDVFTVGSARPSNQSFEEETVRGSLERHRQRQFGGGRVMLHAPADSDEENA